MPSTRPLILLVRHGRTALNEGKPKLRAWEDPPLDRMGEMDADLAGQKLKQYSPMMLYHSDLTRDTQTGEIIAKRLGNIPSETDYRLRTANMGVWSGAVEEDVRPMVLKWYQQPWVQAPSGESYGEFLRRFYPAFDEKLEISRGIESFCPTVVVTHGRNVAALHSRYKMLPPEKADMPLPGGMAIVYERPDGTDGFEFLSETEPVQEDA